jgi:DNA-directed RNA polymerase subunit RPC12/RpoP
MVTTAVVCARCGREAPSDPVELAKWRCGKPALEEEIAEGLVLCSDCDAEDRAGEFEEGEGG